MPLDVKIPSKIILQNPRLKKQFLGSLKPALGDFSLNPDLSTQFQSVVIKVDFRPVRNPIHIIVLDLNVTALVIQADNFPRE